MAHDAGLDGGTVGAGIGAIASSGSSSMPKGWASQGPIDIKSTKLDPIQRDTLNGEGYLVSLELMNG